MCIILGCASAIEDANSPFSFSDEGAVLFRGTAFGNIGVGLQGGTLTFSASPSAQSKIQGDNALQFGSPYLAADISGDVTLSNSSINTAYFRDFDDTLQGGICARSKSGSGSFENVVFKATTADLSPWVPKGHEVSGASFTYSFGDLSESADSCILVIFNDPTTGTGDFNFSFTIEGDTVGSPGAIITSVENNLDQTFTQMNPSVLAANDSSVGLEDPRFTQKIRITGSGLSSITDVQVGSTPTSIGVESNDGSVLVTNAIQSGGVGLVSEGFDVPIYIKEGSKTTKRVLKEGRITLFSAEEGASDSNDVVIYLAADFDGSTFGLDGEGSNACPTSTTSMTADPDAFEDTSSPKLETNFAFEPWPENCDIPANNTTWSNYDTNGDFRGGCTLIDSGASNALDLTISVWWGNNYSWDNADTACSNLTEGNRSAGDWRLGTSAELAEICSFAPDTNGPNGSPNLNYPFGGFWASDKSGGNHYNVSKNDGFDAGSSCALDSSIKDANGSHAICVTDVDTGYSTDNFHIAAATDHRKPSDGDKIGILVARDDDGNGSIQNGGLGTDEYVTYTHTVDTDIEGGGAGLIVDIGIENLTEANRSNYSCGNSLTVP